MRLVHAILWAGISAMSVSCREVSDPKMKGVVDDDAFGRQREKMVAEQIVPRGVIDERVLRTLRKVPRHLFVPIDQRANAYEDRPIPIGHGQTISQPYIVGFMTESLGLKSGQKVLEIGTGSGYQAAVLSEMGAQTFSVEIVPELSKFAENNLKNASYDNVRLKTGDGYQGWKEHAPFDAVIVTCAPEKVPAPLEQQLKENGKMVIPVGNENDIQELVLIVKQGGILLRKTLAPVRFVPMKGEARERK